MKNGLKIYTLLSIIFFTFILFALEAKYLEYGHSLNKEETNTFNFKKRLYQINEMFSSIEKSKVIKNSPIYSSLLRWNGLANNYLNNDVSQSEQEYRYFDLVLFNIINLKHKLATNKNIKYLRVALQPRLTYQFLTSLKGKTYLDNAKVRVNFILDFSSSSLAKESGFFTANEKFRIKKLMILLEKEKIRRSKKIKHTKDRKNDLIKIKRSIDDVLKIIFENFNKKYTDVDFVGDLFSFNIKSTFGYKTKKIEKNSNKPVVDIIDKTKKVRSDFFDFKFLSIILLIIILFSILLFVVIHLLTKKKQEVPNTNQTVNVVKDLRTPFEEFSTHSKIDSKQDNITKLDSFSKMLVESLPDRYENLWKISKGGMGIVFGANDRLLYRKVAIKMILPVLCDDSSIVNRFVNEARSVASLDHPNILKIFDVGGDEYPFFVMEYLQGVSLDELICQKKKLSQKEIQFYGAQLADAFHYCHLKGIIHRDIKPANILIVNKMRTAKVVDFGIAKDHNMYDVTKTNASIGSPQYMAPEQLKNNKYGASSDIYAFGMTMYKMVTGKLPFDESNFMMKITHDPKHISSYLPDCNKLLASLIMKCIVRDPSHRFVNFNQIKTVLLKIK